MNKIQFCLPGYEEIIRKHDFLRAVSEEVQKRLFEEFIKSQKEQTNIGLVYHYTSDDALRSILKSKNLWVSKSNFMNDKKEIVHTKELVESLLKEKGVNSIGLNIIPKALELCYSEMDFYILSMSLDPNSIVLWKEYGSVNIGFDINILQQIWDDGFFLFDHRKVIYDEKEKREYISNEIDCILEYEQNHNIENNFEYAVLTLLFFNKLLIRSCFFKEESKWSHEQEYRTIFAGVFKHFLTPRQTFNNTANGKTYIKVEWYTSKTQCPIKKITLSSKCKIDNIELETLTREFNIEVDRIKI